MGLTFSQSFYQIPEAYAIHVLEPGDSASASAIFGIIEKPDDEEKDDELHELFESHGYWLKKIDLVDLAREGCKIYREIL